MGRYDGYYGGGWAPYVSVAERRQRAARKIAALKKKGQVISPVRIEGKTIARTFWGKAWCANLEAYSDYSNRLPRGRTYVKNGSVIDLQITRGEITAMVSGSSIYSVNIAIRALEKSRWQALLGQCAGQIDSLVELLQGKFSRGVMEIITDKERGLFPSPRQITMDCSCPDGAVMCKHVAAVLYGVGARLDESPELFFLLRNVDQAELIIAAGTATAVVRSARPDRMLQSADLAGIFGIDVDSGSAVDDRVARAATPKRKETAKRPVTNRDKTPAGAARTLPVTKQTVKAVAAKRPATKRPRVSVVAAKRPAVKGPKVKPAATKRPAAKKAGAA